ncbi:major facilitator superfamily domain-containing protein [Gilbertella persicaria]|uniref:major facilitator superfamily domain-containing protein n=1 Tax=Gilbertella persicaria TaxID=101096 RepID=UPI00221E62D4|nr:major facilitator superfamily domain-containing protein [Gilbertella persicaria]KAI8091104.1 major facilitator superfamily domain-containing protein [Gilbertella persicaria]
MISPLTASIYLPSLIQIQEDLKTTTENVNLTVTAYMVFQAISPTFWGTIADSYGRRVVLISTVFIYCCASIGLALTPNYAALLVFRMLQAFGSSSVIAIGAGVLGDIADSERRGSYFGVYQIGQMSGPLLGPLLGGIISEGLGWRWIFWITLIIGALSIVLVSLFVPETLRALVGNGSGYANPTPFQFIARRQGKLDKEKIQAEKQARGPRPRMNFFSPFLYLLEPDVFLSLIFSGFIYMSMYCFMTSTTKQFSMRYGLSELEIGFCYLCMGAGTIIGGFIKGKLLDRDFRKTAKETEHMSHYKARLRSCWISLFFSDALPIVYGWCLQVNAPLAVPLVLQFLVGLSNSSLTICVQSLLIDLFPGKGASITASNNLVRCILGAIASSVIDPGIEGVGVGWMFTIIGLLVTLFNICVPVLLRLGPRWREQRIERLKKTDGQITFRFFRKTEINK